MKPASVRTQRDEDWEAGGPPLRQLAVVETHAVCDQQTVIDPFISALVGAFVHLLLTAVISSSSNCH